MRKLLSANIFRLFKSKVFWAMTLAMSGMGLYCFFMVYIDNVRYQENHLFDDVLMNYTVFIGLAIPIFTSLFFGTEYSDGAIRNKLAVGHTRASIYCSGWLTGMIAAAFMVLAYLLAFSVPGAFLLGAPRASAGKILLMMLLSFFVMMEYVSIFHMLSMLLAKRSVSAVLGLLSVLVLFALAIAIKGRLDAPELVSEYALTVNGIEMLEPEPNPRYLQPGARMAHQFFYDLLPSGQSMQIASFDVAHPYLLALYSALTSALAAMFGCVMFRKKDLK